MSESQATAPLNLGFLTVLHDASGFLGGYLATNLWGRPLEFRLSSAVQPNRLHQALYAGTLRPYLCADLIGKALLDKSTVPVGAIFTDVVHALDLRHKVDVPVAWTVHAERADLRPGHAPAPPSPDHSIPTLPVRGPVHCHGRYPQDAESVAALLDRINGLIDLAEPFARVREAIAEARKMGALGRQ